VIEVVAPGLLTTVQDRGRPGHAAIGVPHGGAVDLALAAHCNRLVGNDDGAAVLETVGGLRLRAVTAVVIATDLEPVARSLRPGEWHYVAVRGGIDVTPVLGSRSTDTLSGLGPPSPEAGDRLAVGPEPARRPIGETWPPPDVPDIALITPGPRADWFARVDDLVVRRWTVTDVSRVGVRLGGGGLERVVEVELPSEGLVRGAIQVPPDGHPIVMLADHPTTGGYPVAAVVEPECLAAVSQRPVGSSVRFGWRPDDAPR
jgi:allophanate hydrolase subunit 2